MASTNSKPASTSVQAETSQPSGSKPRVPPVSANTTPTPAQNKQSASSSSRASQNSTAPKSRNRRTLPPRPTPPQGPLPSPPEAAVTTATPNSQSTTLATQTSTSKPPKKTPKNPQKTPQNGDSFLDLHSDGEDETASNLDHVTAPASSTSAKTTGTAQQGGSLKKRKTPKASRVPADQSDPPALASTPRVSGSSLPLPVTSAPSRNSSQSTTAEDPDAPITTASATAAAPATAVATTPAAAKMDRPPRWHEPYVKAAANALTDAFAPAASDALWTHAFVPAATFAKDRILPPANIAFLGLNIMGRVAPTSHPATSVAPHTVTQTVTQTLPAQTVTERHFHTVTASGNGAEAKPAQPTTVYFPGADGKFPEPTLSPSEAVNKLIPPQPTNSGAVAAAPTTKPGASLEDLD